MDRTAPIPADLDREDVMRAVHEIRKHHDDYALAEKYYWGEVGELFVSPAVRRVLNRALGGFDVNLARRPVDAVLDRLKINAVSVPSGEEQTRALVDTVWTPNRMNRYSKRVHWAALVYGDAYLIVWPGEDDNTVEIHYNSPLGTRLFYSAENPRVKEFGAKLWTEGSGDSARHRVNLYYADRVEKWTTAKGAKGEQDSEWFPFETETEEWSIENPFGEVPMFHWRTTEQYGRPEHKDAYGPQNSITKLTSTMMATVDYQGFPQRYELLRAATQGAGALQFTDDGVNPDENDDDLEAGPGTVLNFPNAEKVGQFDPANMDAFLKPLGVFVRLMASATATPMRFFDPVGVVPSGEALRADEGPLTARIHDRQDLFSEEWQEALVFAAKIVGLTIAAPDMKWAPVQVIDDQEGWQTVLLKMKAGVPPLQALTEAGYQSDLVESWLAAAAGQPQENEDPPPNEDDADDEPAA